MSKQQPSSAAQTTIAKEKIYKLTIAAKRNPNLSETEFHDYWSNVHGPKAAAWMARWGVLSYVQYHTKTEDKAQVVPFGMQVIEWDGTAEVLVRDISTFAVALQDPEYIEHLAPEEEFLFDKRPGGMAVTIGTVDVYLRDGKVLDIPKRHGEAL
ncbi:hypothetical protein K440DRAFT_664883 [Wilcoxina mikolae CBS 423.85]|nr:hypothetical protein K440DRAFT_664883 [Wilcoxina mikolae CBS 423.85]